MLKGGMVSENMMDITLDQLSLNSIRNRIQQKIYKLNTAHSKSSLYDNENVKKSLKLLGKLSLGPSKRIEKLVEAKEQEIKIVE